MQDSVHKMDTQNRQRNSRTGADGRHVSRLKYFVCPLSLAFLLSGCANHRAKADADTSDSSPPAVARPGSGKLAVVAPLKTVSDSRPAAAGQVRVADKPTLVSPKAAEQQPVATRTASPKVVSAQIKPAVKPAAPPEAAPISNEITANEALPQNALVFKGPRPVAAVVPIRRATPWFLIWVGVSFVVVLIGAAIWRALLGSARANAGPSDGRAPDKLSLQGAPKGPEAGLGE